MSHTLRRLMIVGIALAVIVAAIAWVSVTFTDRSFACGTAVGEARHRETVPAVIVGLPRHLPPGLHGYFTTQVGTGGVSGAGFVTVCRGQARARLAESGAAIVLALIGVGVALRPRRKRPPNIATG
jgi:hypothetical protein